VHYLLDACALIAICNNEPGVGKVLDLIRQARTGDIQLSMSIVQLLEVYYDRIYVAGENDASLVVKSILAEPITIIESVSLSVMYEAGRFKTFYSMSLADSIAAATARNISATLVTKDGEMREAEEAGEFLALWIKDEE